MTLLFVRDDLPHLEQPPDPTGSFHSITTALVLKREWPPLGAFTESLNDRYEVADRPS